MTIVINIKSKNMHTGINQLIENSEIIGYLVENNNTEKEASIVLPNGDNLGDYCCEQCAVNAAWKKHHNIINTEQQSTPSGIPRSLLLMALIAAMAR